MTYRDLAPPPLSQPPREWRRLAAVIQACAVIPCGLVGLADIAFGRRYRGSPEGARWVDDFSWACAAAITRVCGGAWVYTEVSPHYDEWRWEPRADFLVARLAMEREREG